MSIYNNTIYDYMNSNDHFIITSIPHNKMLKYALYYNSSKDVFELYSAQQGVELLKQKCKEVIYSAVHDGDEDFLVFSKNQYDITYESRSYDEQDEYGLLPDAEANPILELINPKNYKHIPLVKTVEIAITCGMTEYGVGISSDMITFLSVDDFYRYLQMYDITDDMIIKKVEAPLPLNRVSKSKNVNIDNMKEIFY